MYFEPIAQKHKLPLVRIEDGIYEVPSPHYILHIEAYAGHSSRGLSASLRKTTLCTFVRGRAGFQYGIGWFMSSKGENIDYFNFQINDDDDFLKMAQLYADATERFGISYLLGQTDDYEAVREFAEKEVKAREERTKQTQRNIQIKMKNVRQEWPVIVTRQKGDEWETVNELKATDIRFLGNLEGAKENVFKERLTELFKNDRNVERAYLARVIGQNLPANGVLCLQRQAGFDKRIRRKIGEIFSDVFSIQDNFYILFPANEQESSLAKVCQAFFVGSQ